MSGIGQQPGLFGASLQMEDVVTIATRLTERFGIKHPIVLAPMTPAAGGVLASAVAAAGGLGLLGGGYVDRDWFETESAKVTRSDVGAGFIAWTIPEDHFPNCRENQHEDHRDPSIILPAHVTARFGGAAT
jgi:hypothetical protein